MVTKAKQRGHDCGGEGRGKLESAMLKRSKQVAAEFAHHPIPDWSESRRMCANRSHLDTIAAPA
jgi:hypothetical protein